MSPIAPKRLLHEDIAGVCVRDGLISAARVARTSGGGVRLRSVGWAEYTPGLSDDDLSAAIRQAWRKMHMPTRTVAGCLHTESLQLKHFRYENLSRDELRSTLTLEAEELLRRSRKQLAIDWHLFSNGTGHGALEGILAATPEREVERQMLLLKHAGLYTVVLDIGSLAAANLYRALHPPGEGPEALCLLDLSRNSADAVVLFRDGFAYPRVLHSHAATWDAAAEYLADHLADLFRHLRFRLRRPPVEGIRLTGRVNDPRGVAAHLHHALGLPVETWNPLDHLVARWPARLRTERERHAFGPWLCTAIGLALRGAARDDV